MVSLVDPQGGPKNNAGPPQSMEVDSLAARLAWRLVPR